MPFYEYQCTESGCAYCQIVFEVFAKLSDPELTHCPQCGGPVKQLISAPSVISSNAHLLNEKNAAAKGFTQYRKAGGGVYEKAYGDGPQYISDDGK